MSYEADTDDQRLIMAQHFQSQWVPVNEISIPQRWVPADEISVPQGTELLLPYVKGSILALL